MPPHSFLEPVVLIDDSTGPRRASGCSVHRRAERCGAAPAPVRRALGVQKQREERRRAAVLRDRGWRATWVSPIGSARAGARARSPANASALRQRLGPLSIAAHWPCLRARAAPSPSSAPIPRHVRAPSRSPAERNPSAKAKPKPVLGHRPADPMARRASGLGFCCPRTLSRISGAAARP